MKKFVFTVWLALFPLFPACAMNGKLVLETMLLPPFVCYENDRITGSDVEIIHEVCRHLGIEPEIRVVPFKRVLEDVKEGHVAGNFPIYYRKDRESFLYYPSESYNTRSMVLLALKEKHLKISSLDDLAEKTVAVVSGYSYGSGFDNDTRIEKEVCNTDEELLKILVKGRREFAATEKSVAMYVAGKLEIQDQIEVLHVLSEDPLYITFSRAAGIQGKILAQKFSESLRQLKREGKISQIIQKYQLVD